MNNKRHPFHLQHSGATSRTGRKRTLKTKDAPNSSYCLGNYKGFRGYVPGTAEGQNMYFLLYHNSSFSSLIFFFTSVISLHRHL